MKSEFRQLAESAKQRLKNGYWQEMYGKRDSAIKEAEESGKSVSVITADYRKILKDTLMGSEIRFENEDKKRHIIEEILDTDDIVTNPLGRLIDFAKLQDMSEADKDRYILMISREYLELRQRICNERRVII